MPTIAAKPVSNLSVKQGEVLIEQNSNPNTLIFLHQGRAMFAVKQNSNSSFNANKDLFSVQSPSIVGASSLILEQTYNYSVLTASPSTLSTYDGGKEALIQILASKPNMAIILLRSLLKETIEAYNKINMVNTTAITISRYIASLGLAFFKLFPKAIQEAEKKTDDPVLSFSHDILKFQLSKGNRIPELITMDFLRGDYLDPEHQTVHLHTQFDRDELNYLRHFSSLAPPILSAISTKDPQLILMTAQKIGNVFSNLLNGLVESIGYLEKTVSLLCSGHRNLLEKGAYTISHFQGRGDPRNEEGQRNFLQFLMNSIDILNKQYQSLWSVSLLENINQLNINQIRQFLQMNQNSLNREEQITPSQTRVNPKILEESANTAQKVFNYSELPPSKFQDYARLMSELRQFKNPLDTESHVRKIRNSINTLYWEVYEASILKHFKSTDRLPKYLEAFFNYGVLEENLLNPDQIAFIYSLEDNINCKYPIHTPLDWMRQIYEKKVKTSINELGLTFFEIVRQKQRNSTWRKESDMPPEFNTPEALLSFEIKNMVTTNVKLTSGSVITSLAPLSRYQITKSIEKAIVNKNTLASQIDRLLDIDFSAFHREVLYENDQMGILREFIQVQVVPNFILMPTAGPNIQFWQEREGKDKLSRGRLISPAFATEDLFKMLLSSIGAYRWELVKVIMGPDWNNISQPSMTADYTDYIQFFKKNRDLSPEAKEKIAQDFKRFRDDRSRFVYDYCIWVLYESEGTQRLNKVARKIMAKYIPFRAPYRERLLKLPSYIDLVNKNINIRKRKASEMEPRFKKYRQNNNGELPNELLETYKFYNMEY